jgi:hypothetical protein
MERDMPEILANLYKHARECPVACFLQLLCLYNFFIVTKIAILQQAGISNTLYILLLASNGIVAMLALAMRRGCQIKFYQAHRDI